MLRALSMASYGNDANMEEYQVQQIRERVATLHNTPQGREAWTQLKTNKAFTEQMYWQIIIEAGEENKEIK